jgi:hypothetical protein
LSGMPAIRYARGVGFRTSQPLLGSHLMFDEDSPFPWLESLLVLSIIALVLQLFPGLMTMLDFRTWRWYVWSGINVGVIVVLLFLREYYNNRAS